MKKCTCLIIFISCIISSVFAQSDSTTKVSSWELNANASLYFIPDDFFVLPVLKADKNKVHLEARYNYESRETFSGWLGYNFTGGNKLEYTITPMIGGVVGKTDGIAPGIEITMDLGNFSFYNESEHVFDFESTENNFYYMWTDLTYSPKDWLWFGISGQRTRLIISDLDIQRGLIIGSGFKQWNLNLYAYNPWSDDSYLILSLSKEF